MKTAEFRVRPVTRYVVTKFTQEDYGVAGGCGSECLGEFQNEILAHNALLAFIAMEERTVGGADVIQRRDNNPATWVRGQGWSDSPVVHSPLEEVERGASPNVNSGSR